MKILVAYYVDGHSRLSLIFELEEDRKTCVDLPRVNMEAINYHHITIEEVKE